MKTKNDVSHFKTRDGDMTLEQLISAENPAYVEKVVWTDGNWAWAKSWQRWDKEAKVWRTARVGAGAYGNLTLWYDGRP